MKCTRPSRGDSSHTENSLDVLAETYGNKDADIKEVDSCGIADIPR